MKNWHVLVLSTAIVVTPLLSSCSSEPTSERYVSPRIQGEAKQINLDEVQKAFWETKGNDFNSWMAAFEKRVNEIYDGKGVVSLDANRKSGKMVVIGYIAKGQKEGFQPGDEKLFSIEQTGDVVNNQLPYKVSNHEGRPYYEGHRSILDNPFIQMMVFSHLMGGWRGYSTPYPQTVVLQQHRDSFRQTPGYAEQRQANSRYRMKTGTSELQSRNRFGSTQQSGGSTSTRRSWGSSSGSDSGSGSMWGGRRSSGSGFSFGRRGGWGRRR
jgi:hypothetical protein